MSADSKTHVLNRQAAKCSQVQSQRCISFLPHPLHPEFFRRPLLLVSAALKSVLKVSRWALRSGLLKTWILAPDLLLTPCLILGLCLSLSEPSFIIVSIM